MQGTLVNDAWQPDAPRSFATSELLAWKYSFGPSNVANVV